MKDAKCPICHSLLIQRIPSFLQLLDITVLYCETCKKEFIYSWRTKNIKEK